MHRSDVRVILTSASLTALLALPIALPLSVSAEPEPTAALGLVERAPTFEFGGVVVSARPTQPTWTAGTPLAFVATFHNPSKRPARAAVTFSLSRQAPGSEFSRMRVMPVEAWTQPVVVDLGPGETRELPLATGVALTAGESGSLAASAGEHSTVFAYVDVTDPADGATDPGSLIAPARPPLVRPRLRDATAAPNAPPSDPSAAAPTAPPADPSAAAPTVVAPAGAASPALPVQDAQTAPPLVPVAQAER